MTIYPCPKPTIAKRPKAVFVEPSIMDLRAERGEFCEWCNYLYSIGERNYRNQAEQRHHCLVPDRIRFHAEVTVRENLMQACMDCHTGRCLLDRREVREIFWSIQCERYGVDHMEDWVRGLNPKLWISGRIDFLPSITIDTSYNRKALNEH